MRPPVHAGFTLIETLLATAVLALLAALALPAMGSIARNARTTSTGGLLTSHFAFARVAAVRHNATVAVCPLAPEDHCATDADWSDGWMVFLDPNGNHRPDAQPQILQVEHRHGGRQHIHSSSGRAQLRYHPDGTSAGSNLTIWICENQQLQMALIANNTGRVRSARPATSTPCPP